MDPAAAAKALNTPASSAASPRVTTVLPGGTTAGQADRASSTAAAESHRRSLNGSAAAATSTTAAADRLPTTRVSVASPDRASRTGGAAGASSTDAGTAAAVLAAHPDNDTASKRKSIIVTTAASHARRSRSTASTTHDEEESGLNAVAVSGQDASDDAASVRSDHTLKTIRGSQLDSPPELAAKLNQSNGGGGAGGGGLLLLPTSDDADDEPAASAIQAWQDVASSPHRVGAGADLENTGIPTDPIELSRWRRQVLLRTGIRLFILFVVCTIALIGTLWIALPTIDEKDRPFLKIPKSLADLKALNDVLQHYKTEHTFRVALCWFVVYMFLQAFSIPGSMYMSILAGALWGVPIALPLVCASVATGATICYLISQTMGEALVAVPKWKARVDSWKDRLAEYNDNLLSYLIIIRMMPLPPHNVVNLLAPHLGIRIPLFWLSTALGIFAVSFIHTTIGEKLDDMASSDDFHLLSARNALLFLGVCGAVMIPVLLRKRAPVQPLEEEEEEGGVGAVRLPDDDEDDEGARGGSGQNGGVVALGRSLLGLGARGLGRPGQARSTVDAVGQRRRRGLGEAHDDYGDEEDEEEDDDLAAFYDEDADELPPVSGPAELAAAASRSLSRASSFQRSSRAGLLGTPTPTPSKQPTRARVLRPPGPPGPEDVDELDDPAQAWRERPLFSPRGFSALSSGVNGEGANNAGGGDVSDAPSEESHLSAPFSEDRHEAGAPRGRPSRGRSGRAGGFSRSGRAQGRPGTWSAGTGAGVGADALGRVGGVVEDVAGRVRSWFGSAGSGGVALR